MNINDSKTELRLENPRPVEKISPAVRAVNPSNWASA